MPHSSPHCACALICVLICVLIRVPICVLICVLICVPTCVLICVPICVLICVPICVLLWQPSLHATFFTALPARASAPACTHACACMRMCVCVCVCVCVFVRVCARRHLACAIWNQSPLIRVALRARIEFTHCFLYTHAHRHACYTHTSSIQLRCMVPTRSMSPVTITSIPCSSLRRRMPAT